LKAVDFPELGGGGERKINFSSSVVNGGWTGEDFFKEQCRGGKLLGALTKEDMPFLFFKQLGKKN